VLIALVLEEVIPLLVLYAPFMLPSTCVLPSQAARIARARRERQLAFSALGPEFAVIRDGARDAGAVPLKQVHGASLQALCGCVFPWV
jgi:hypothetical protein